MRAGDDLHLHLRSGAMLRAVLPHTARQFKRAVIMPNAKLKNRDYTGIFDERDMEEYREEILSVADGYDFEPLMTIQVTERTTPQIILKTKAAGSIAGKVYPRGMTTNSENGVLNYPDIFPALGAMEECGMLALFHGESPDPNVFCLDREVEFLKTLKMIASTFPRLRIVLEHVTTAAAVECVAELGDNVAATITVHHLFLTLDDVIGGRLEPHNFCKPVAKRPEDRAALIAATTSGNPKFFLGTDSAPHLKRDKECASGCAGNYTAPVATPLLVQRFLEVDAPGKLENFYSGFGADHYGLPRNRERITLVREKWTVQPEYDGVVPFYAGREMAWRVE
jgi:dihydroorotase